MYAHWMRAMAPGSTAVECHMADVAPPPAPGMDEHHELSQPQQMAHVGTAVMSACTFAVRSAVVSHFVGTAEPSTL